MPLSGFEPRIIGQPLSNGPADAVKTVYSANYFKLLMYSLILNLNIFPLFSKVCLHICQEIKLQSNSILFAMFPL